MKAEARIRFPLSVDISGKKVLIVDDVTDTGDTLKLSIGYVQSLNASEISNCVLQHKNVSFVPDLWPEIIRWPGSFIPGLVNRFWQVLPKRI